MRACTRARVHVYTISYGVHFYKITRSCTRIWRQ